VMLASNPSATAGFVTGVEQAARPIKATSDKPHLACFMLLPFQFDQCANPERFFLSSTQTNYRHDP